MASSSAVSGSHSGTEAAPVSQSSNEDHDVRKDKTSSDGTSQDRVGTSDPWKDSTTISEGSVKIMFRGSSSAFYNPVQEFNRDLTVTVLQQFVEDRFKGSCGDFSNGKDDQPPSKKLKTSHFPATNGIHILDALSASGLRAVRFAKEVPYVQKVVANDFSENAVDTIKKNIEINGVESIVEAHFGDAVETMVAHRSYSNRMHAIDLDPYGSASVFLDSAVQAVADGGILMVTCTDMAVLCGNTPEACYNKYGSVGLRHKCCHEFAIRILLKSIDSHANRYARYIEPLLSVSVDFYVRVFVRMHTSAQLAKDSATRVSHVFACTGCQSLQLQPLIKKTVAGSSVRFLAPTLSAGLLDGEGKCVHCGSSVHIAGPIYSAPIHSKSFVGSLIERLKLTAEKDRLSTYDRLLGVLSVIAEELQDVPLYYEYDQLMHIVKCPVPRIINVRSAILNAGYRCSISHCNPKALKTDAPLSLLWDIARRVARDNNVDSSRFSENSIGRRIFEGKITHDVNFRMHPDAQSKSKMENLLRFQFNKGRNWGPKAKAKGSVNSVQAGFQIRPE